MDIASSLMQAANIMLTGMVVVFIFLAILIGAIKLMTHLVGQEPEPLKPKKSAGFKSAAVPNAHIAAISAAVHQYRNQEK
ncbi:OadG family protein [Pseudoalteromonas tunicata]|nr:OadG family transporter subunit [Pseudoalteromonas tunicata]ATC93785.1 oxaloacetate decarboxylase, gamma subunit [Pseudoalteromonas tunicata]AXT29605.1 oxaloacetate decarboxylase [Pseudoalteromonas tunicata]MDP4985645.1 OadG family transporter subunit [Pseudoalteromonas tunicata]MDP5214895.1 OadG family transporter subunit [Pseudoalteromonas tunicata]